MTAPMLVCITRKRDPGHPRPTTCPRFKCFANLCRRLILPLRCDRTESLQEPVMRKARMQPDHAQGVNTEVPLAINRFANESLGTNGDIAQSLGDPSLLTGNVEALQRATPDTVGRGEDRGGDVSVMSDRHLDHVPAGQQGTGAEGITRAAVPVVQTQYARAPLEKLVVVNDRKNTGIGLHDVAGNAHHRPECAARA